MVYMDGQVRVRRGRRLAAGGGTGRGQAKIAMSGADGWAGGYKHGLFYLSVTLL